MKGRGKEGPWLGVSGRAEVAVVPSLSLNRGLSTAPCAVGMTETQRGKVMQCLNVCLSHVC